MRLLNRFHLSYETSRTLLAALAIVGLLAVIYGVYLFISSSSVLARAEDIQARISDLPPEQTQAVLSAVPVGVLAEQRQAVRDRVRSLIVGGIGLVAVGGAWLGYDFVSRRKSPPQT